MGIINTTTSWVPRVIRRLSLEFINRHRETI